MKGEEIKCVSCKVLIKVEDPEMKLLYEFFGPVKTMCSECIKK